MPPHPAGQPRRGQHGSHSPGGEWHCRCAGCQPARFFWRCFSISNAAHQINEDIRDKEIRLIGSDGAQLGIMSAEAALEIAAEQDLDLVKISPTSNPPVCKIMDYGKYRFEQSKRVSAVAAFCFFSVLFSKTNRWIMGV